MKDIILDKRSGRKRAMEEFYFNDWRCQKCGAEAVALSPSDLLITITCKRGHETVVVE